MGAFSRPFAARFLDGLRCLPTVQLYGNGLDDDQPSDEDAGGLLRAGHRTATFALRKDGMSPGEVTGGDGTVPGVRTPRVGRRVYALTA